VTAPDPSYDCLDAEPSEAFDIEALMKDVK